MRRANKILMATVAILLCLVLISTSVVSGVFARFVIKKESVTEVKLSQYGITVTFEGIGNSIEKTGDSVTYKKTSVTMLPNSVAKQIKATISGKPTVASTIIINVDITSSSDFTIVGSQDFTNIKNNTSYFPIGFKVGANTSYDINPYSTDTLSTIASNIESKITGKLTGLTFSDDNTSGGKKATWGTSTTVNETNIGLTFDWPKDYATNTISDEIGTYLATRDLKFDITYTISIKQN